MNSDEVWARCQQCGAELKQGDRECPKCGSSKKAFAPTLRTTVRPTPNLSTKHEVHLSSISKIPGIIITIFGFLLALLLPEIPFVIRLTMAIIILTIVVVLIFNNKMRYSLIMFLRQLDNKTTASKIYGDKKKPH